MTVEADPPPARPHRQHPPAEFEQMFYHQQTLTEEEGLQQPSLPLNPGRSTLLDSKVILKYTLIHLTELALIVAALIFFNEFVDISIWITVSILVILVLKDILLFPKVWRAYTFGDSSPKTQIIGLEATVMDSLNPVGYVRARGELWKAEVSNPLYPAQKGDRTRVIDIKGTTLIVERCDDRQTQLG